MRITALGLLALFLVGCTSSQQPTSTRPTSRPPSVSGSPTVTATVTPSPQPNTSAMVTALGLPALLPEASKIGPGWTIDGVDGMRSAVPSVAECQNVAVDETERLAGISRQFVLSSGNPDEPIIVYIGAYRPGGAAKVLAALRTCSIAPRPAATTVKSSSTEITRCSVVRPMCFTIRLVGDRLVGTAVYALAPPTEIAAIAIRTNNVVAQGAAA